MKTGIARQIVSMCLIVAAWMGTPCLAQQEFNPKSVKEWMKNNVPTSPKIEVGDEERVARLLARAIQFRERAGTDLQKAVDGLAGGGGPFAIITEAKINREVPEVWPYFFAGTIVHVGHSVSSEPVTAFYNPYLDAACMIYWKASASDVVPEKVLVVTGNSMRGEKKSDAVPWWLREGRGTPVDLLKQYQQFKDYFAATFPFHSGDMPARVNIDDPVMDQRVLELNALKAFLELVAVTSPKDMAGVRKPLRIFRDALATQEMEALDTLIPKDNVVKARTLADLPVEIRQRLTPVFVQVRTEQTIVFLNSDASARFFLAAAFASNGKLSSVAFLDFETKSKLK